MTRQVPFRGRTTLLTALLATFPASALAQNTLVLPVEYDRAWGRGSSSLLGGSSTRTQLVFANPFPIGTVLLGVGLRPTASTSDRAAFTADVEVRASSTAAVPGALSSTFANNVGSDEVIVLPRQMVPIPAMPANRSTGLFAQFPFATPFVFGTNTNTNICIEVLVHGRSTGASWSTDRGFATASGRATTAGMGCGSASVGSTSSGGSYVAGSTISITLSGAPPTTFAMLLAAFDMKEFAPGLLLPFDLSLVGAGAGCDLLLNPGFGPTGFLTDGSGAASTSLTVPGGFGQLGIGWQWAYLVAPGPANPIGLETTANRQTWLGPEVIVPGAQYVWDLSSVGSATGNATTDSVPVVQFVLP